MELAERLLWDEEMKPEYIATPDAIWVSQYEYNWIYNSLPPTSREDANLPGGWCALVLPDGRLLRSHPLMSCETKKPNINRTIVLYDSWPRETAEAILTERTNSPESCELWISQAEYNRIVDTIPMSDRQAAVGLSEGWEGLSVEGRILRVDARFKESSVYESEVADAEAEYIEKNHVKRVCKGSSYIMIFPKSCFSEAEIDRINGEIESAGAKLIIAAYNNNATGRPTIHKID